MPRQARSALSLSLSVSILMPMPENDLVRLIISTSVSESCGEKVKIWKKNFVQFETTHDDDDDDDDDGDDDNYDHDDDDDRQLGPR